MKLQRRTSARVLKVGENKVWFDPSRLADIKEAITKEDIRELIKEDAIKAKPKKGISRGRFRKRLKQKRKGLRRGTGKRKGKRVAKKWGKKVWMKKVRVLRRVLTENREKLSKENYQKIRNKIKAGTVKDKKNLLGIIRDIK